MVVKKLLGADSVLMVYNLRDRLVATQDGVQRSSATASNRDWSFTKYDKLDRPVLTGTIKSPNTRVQMQTVVNTYSGVNPSNSALTRVADKPTVNKLRQLDPASSTEVWFTTASFYDKYYRIIQWQNSGVQGGSVKTTSEYNFPGWLIKSKETQTVVQGTTTLTNSVLTRNGYDHQGRLLNTYHKINTGTEKTLSTLSYNELGQLISKKLHVTSGTGLQKIDYTYNIRGWLKKINEPDLSGGEGDFFGMELLYNEGFAALNGSVQWNGNISGLKFRNSTSGAPQKGYGFIYDQLNRLTTSKYGEGTSYTSNVGRYDENLTYDRNGNIRKLYRNGQISTGVFGNIDSLAYKYTGTGNQVRAIGDIVTDVAGRGDFHDATNGYTNKEYYYDRNGNMWLDRNKRMKTVYNYLNLPARVSDTVNTANKIEYVYTSAGEKLKQRLSTGTTLMYLGNFVYILDGTANGIAVKYILTPEGRATYSSGAYTYEYFMKDHLGNTRVSFNVPGSTAVIVQQSDYYPYGMMHKPQAVTTSDNRHLFNGKEFQNNLLGGVNLDLYDYQARFYDPQIGRFTTIDPASELGRRWSPYAYVLNNPMIYVDPTGMSEDYYENDKGKIKWFDNTASEIVDKNMTTWKNIGTSYVSFSGSNLKLNYQNTDDFGNLSPASFSVPAVSGRSNKEGKFDYSIDRQGLEDVGPLPQGRYTINPSDIQKMSLYDDFEGTIGGLFGVFTGKKLGGWPGGDFAWGLARLDINPKSVKIGDVIRSGFTIHGGADPGSAGCIDLIRCETLFFDKLQKYSSGTDIVLKVDYSNIKGSISSPFNKAGTWFK